MHASLLPHLHDKPRPSDPHFFDRLRNTDQGTSVQAQISQCHRHIKQYRQYSYNVRRVRADYCCSEKAASIRLRLICDGTRAETRFRLSAKRTSPFKSAGASVQSTTGSQVVRISVSNAGYTMFRGSVKSSGCSLHSPVSPSLPLPCVTVCHHISTGVYLPR